MARGEARSAADNRIYHPSRWFIEKKL